MMISYLAGKSIWHSVERNTYHQVVHEHGLLSRFLLKVLLGCELFDPRTGDR